jgi:hypothetical protein
VTRAATRADQPQVSAGQHQDGIVDADDVAKSGERRYEVGQRLVVTPAEVRRLADVTEKLAAALVSLSRPSADRR